MARFLAAVALCTTIVTSQPNIDGGRGDLPGMKQDMFDQVKKNKGKKPGMGKGPPDCPKSDKMAAFTSVAFTNGEVFVRLDASDGPCHKLISIGGANHSVLKNASLTCGPVGEWKKRIAEEMSMVFFQGGLDWVRSENETVEVITEQCEGEVCTNHTIETMVTEAKYEELLQCWAKSCGCEQANNPKMKIILFSIFLCALGGLGLDSFKLAWESFKGGKPPKHVQCKKGHRMVEVAFAYSHICDICRKTGTAYQCSVTCNYDMCKACYKAAKKKARSKFKLWIEKHPEDEDAKKGASKDDDEDDENKKNDDSQSEGGDKKDTKKESEAESDAQPDGSEADKDDTSATTGDEKAKSDDKSEEDDKDAKDVADS